MLFPDNSQNINSLLIRRMEGGEHMKPKVHSSILGTSLVGVVALVGILCQPSQSFAQGANCSTAPFIVINPASPPRYSLPPGAHHFFRVSMPSIGQLTISTERIPGAFCITLMVG